MIKSFKHCTALQSASFSKKLWRKKQMLSLLKNFIFAHLKDSTEPRKTTTRRAIDCLDGRMTTLNEIHRKRFAATSSDPTGTITPDHVTALTTISFETYSKHNPVLYLLPSRGCLFWLFYRHWASPRRFTTSRMFQVFRMSGNRLNHKFILINNVIHGFRDHHFY